MGLNITALGFHLGKTVKKKKMLREGGKNPVETQIVYNVYGIPTCASTDLLSPNTLHRLPVSYKFLWYIYQKIKNV